MTTKEEVNTHRKTARWAGVFYIIATVAPISTILFTGFLGGGITAGEPIPNYLANVSANERQVIIGRIQFICNCFRVCKIEISKIQMTELRRFPRYTNGELVLIARYFIKGEEKTLCKVEY